MEMTGWRRWVRQPQTTFLRKAAFQVHVWMGLALGLYLVMLSLTGSALVFRRELDVVFRTPRPDYQETATVLTTEQISERATKLYPGYTITFVSQRVRRRDPTITVEMKRGDEVVERLFNPYTGADLGDAVPWRARALLGLAELHDELLMGRDGRWWNGFLSGIVTLLVMTGAIVWWPGSMRWRRAMSIKWSTGWRRMNFDIHSAIGFWMLFMMLLWGVSGVYLGIPELFTAAVDYFAGPDGEGRIARWMEVTTRWMTRLHFGRWRNNPMRIPLQTLWVIMGLAPAVLFITGTIMWWQRVVRRRDPQTGSRVAQSA